MPFDQDISAEFPFEPHFVEVRGSKMHCVDVGMGGGDGDPFLFLHGNPTWSDLWRNVIPHCAPLGRCVAPDLIGMGRSDKPEIEYTFFEQARYLDELIEKLGLDRLTLVLHDWGSALGLHWARRHPDRVKAIAFMEAIVRPGRWKQMPLPLRLIFKRLRHPKKGRKMAVDKNMFIEMLLPQGTARNLTEEEMNRYREPYLDPTDREAVRAWPTQIPLDGEPPNVHEAVAGYFEWLQGSEVPKLLFHVEPAFIIPPALVSSLRRRLPNLETVDLGQGRHFTPEEYPHTIGRGIADWYPRAVARRS
ncbi:MAG: haloalkane dehalogenase [bacterium]|nr:haloalkane dehalogenase [bacterium]